MKYATKLLPAGITTRLFVLDDGALQSIPEVLEQEFSGCSPYLVADDNTWRVAGLQIYMLLANAYADTGLKISTKVFPAVPRLHPLESISQQLAAEFAGLPGKTVPVAIGSGVINDLVKRASGIAGIEYCCVPTACSVDGYTSAGGAMVVDGRKMTMPCPSPAVIVADVSVLSTAPQEMLASGYADLFTKIPAGADWLIAEELGIEPRVTSIWNLVQQDLRDWLQDTGCLDKIFTGLAATGFAMQLYHDSRPASGAEHMLSHIWEMEGLTYHGDVVSHGFQVAIGTIAIVRLMEFAMNLTAEEMQHMASRPQTREQREAEIAKLLELDCYGKGIKDTAMAKFLEGDALQKRRKLIFDKWDAIREKLRQQLYPSQKIVDIFRQAGIPIDYREIGLGYEQYVHAVRTAQLIRKRYTVLDLLYEAGLLDAAINAVLLS